MGPGLPFDSTAGHRCGFDIAGALARAAADPCDRGTAACRCIGGDADGRHRGGNPHHPDADQARLPVSREDIDHPADPGRGQHRCADRHPVYRHQQDRGGAVRRPQLSGGRFGLGRCHCQACNRRRIRRSAVDLAPGARQGEKELLGFRRRSHRIRLGKAGAQSGAADPAVDRHPVRRRIRGRIRTARGCGARGDAVSAKDAGGKGRDRSQAVRRECAEKDRGRDRRFPEE